ncbi:unnamed protein product [Lasius platythorax]|uniref:Uncharacterized protein n=1 Tax=Lasius platythorax TaxID=488582 RepID=A0AAV2NJ18_9HYME
MCDTVAVPGNLVIMELSSGESITYAINYVELEKKKECSSPWVNAETHGREPLEATDESNMVDEIRDSWANWYRPSSTFRVSIYTRRPIVRTASYALILKTYRSFNLTKK